MLQELIRVIITQRNLLIATTFIGAILLFIWFWLISPLTYIAPVTILPPENNKNTGFSSLLQGGDLSSLLSGSSGVNSQLYAQILKSRTVSLFVVDKENLQVFYGTDTRNQAAEKLEKSIFVDVSKEGILKMYVELKTGFFARFSDEKDSVKHLSQKVTLAFMESLDQINQQKLSSRAGKVRKYIEHQLLKTKASLDSAEMALMYFQKKNKTISVPEQVKATLETLAKVKAEIISNEIQLGLLEQNLKSNNVTVIALKAKLEELRQQYYKLESNSSDIFVSFNSAPELGYKLTNLMRDVKILNEVYLILQQQYYKELVQENRDIPTLDILDYPQIPEKEIAPRVIVNTGVGVIFLILAMILIFYLRQLNMFNFLKIQS